MSRPLFALTRDAQEHVPHAGTCATNWSPVHWPTGAPVRPKEAVCGRTLAEEGHFSASWAEVGESLWQRIPCWLNCPALWSAARPCHRCRRSQEGLESKIKSDPSCFYRGQVTLGLRWTIHQVWKWTGKLTVNIQIEYPVLLSCRVGGHTGVLASIIGLSSSQREHAAIWADPEQR